MILSNPNMQVVRKDDPAYRDAVFRLTSPMRYSWGAKSCTLVVPVGTLTDFASVPRGLRNIVTVNGAHRLPAVLHDYLYDRAGLVPTAEGRKVSYTRRDADREFHRAMLAEGVPRFTAAVLYCAVRLFGALHAKLTGGRVF